MIKVINYTPQPLTIMGEVAARCWNSKPSPRIAIECIENNHGRIMEFADVTIEISEYSARVMREIYTHIAGVSRVQASTRYIQYGEFDYYMPENIIKNEVALMEYTSLMNKVSDTYRKLEAEGVKKEDIANILPLGMYSKMILKINVRAILHMAELRMCTRAYSEYREFMDELKSVLSKLDDEWRIITGYMQPKCLVNGYCNEKFSCGLMPKKGE